MTCPPGKGGGGLGGGMLYLVLVLCFTIFFLEGNVSETQVVIKQGRGVRLDKIRINLVRIDLTCLVENVFVETCGLLKFSFLNCYGMELCFGICESRRTKTS